MAVFTEATSKTLGPWLRENYGIELAGEPEPITEGIENTNYRFTEAGGGRFIFTVIEVWDRDVADFCLGLAAHLSSSGMPVPETMRGTGGGRLAAEFAGKPACVVRFVEGAMRMQPDASDCGIIGGHVARLHGAVGGFSPSTPNQRGFAWREEAVARVRPSLGGEDRELLDAALEVDAGMRGADLPSGACHCDLFRNNVLWSNGDVSGIIDFYFAGVDIFMFDLGVVAIDWTMDDDGDLDADKLAALLRGYREVREMTGAEADAFPSMMVLGALRFWMSRIDDHLNPREAHRLVEHKPGDFRNRLATAMAMRDELGAMVGR